MEPGRLSDLTDKQKREVFEGPEWDDLAETVERMQRGMSESSGARLIAAERARQIEIEHWDAQHDDQEHRPGFLAQAAQCYIQSAITWADASVDSEATNSVTPENWPWEDDYWKPKGFKRDLERAGALLAAELDRLERNPYEEYERVIGAKQE